MGKTPTVAALLEKGVRRLRDAGIADAEISARAILGHLLHKSATELQLAAQAAIGHKEQRAFLTLVEKRTRHYPLQYILGEVEFYNVRLRVNPDVLIPRPETEILVETLIENLPAKRPVRLLDVGTGSGNIAIALAANIKNLRVTAVDISEAALKTARKNADLNNVGERITFKQGDCLSADFWDKSGRFMAIVANPPYIGETEFTSLQPEVRLYEPETALLSSGDEFKFYRGIIKNSALALDEDGFLCFEVGWTQANKVAALMRDEYPEMDIKIIRDLADIKRVPP